MNSDRSKRPASPDDSEGVPLEAESTYRLMRQVDAGDADALEQICRRYLPRLQRWAKGRLPAYARSLVDTDDLVQDVLGKTIFRLSRFEYRRKHALQAYVRMALDNRIRMELRRKHPQTEGTEVLDQLGREDASPLESLLGREVIVHYEAALARLKPSDREAIVARLELGCTFAEVADALNKASPDAARKAVARAIVRLAQEMSHDR